MIKVTASYNVSMRKIYIYLKTLYVKETIVLSFSYEFEYDFPSIIKSIFLLLKLSIYAKF